MRTLISISSSFDNCYLVKVLHHLWLALYLPELVKIQLVTAGLLHLKCDHSIFLVSQITFNTILTAALIATTQMVAVY